MPLALDPFQQIVNVHWGGEKLAVDINGHLSLKSPGDFSSFNKTTMAFWFRIPDASMSAAEADFTARWNEDQLIGNDYTLLGIVPLVTFGPREDWKLATDSGVEQQSWFAKTGWVGYYCAKPRGQEIAARNLTIRIHGLPASITLIGGTEATISGDDFWAVGNSQGLMVMVRDIP